MNPFSIIIPALAYIIGSIPFGLLIGKKTAGIDISQEGSGNIGAANIARILGLKYGAATLALDCVKGFIPVHVALIFFSQDIAMAVLTGLCAVVGHIFSIFLRFRGGKGVATGLGVFLALAPLNALICIILFIITVILWDFISLGSIIASLAMPLSLCFIGQDPTLVGGSLLMSLLICLKHKGNIQRLLRGKEKKWKNKV
ncbi:MAG: glycerol-3-phosphate 1-O-acyltransferase PlsY [Deltaproteobacteria bacterium]|nr:glycerol-3-phosphate 1-O-acyltransferase PlsY [Deltaproteobacteria bacterium]